MQNIGKTNWNDHFFLCRFKLQKSTMHFAFWILCLTRKPKDIYCYRTTKEGSCGCKELNFIALNQWSNYLFYHSMASSQSLTGSLKQLIGWSGTLYFQLISKLISVILRPNSRLISNFGVAYLINQSKCCKFMIISSSNQLLQTPCQTEWTQFRFINISLSSLL